MHQSDLALEKYLMTQSGYFRFTTAVALGMGILDKRLFFYHGISEQIRDNKISIIKYNYKTVFYCLKNLLQLIVVVKI